MISVRHCTISVKIHERSEIKTALRSQPFEAIFSRIRGLQSVSLLHFLFITRQLPRPARDKSRWYQALTILHLISQLSLLTPSATF